MTVIEAGPGIDGHTTRLTSDGAVLPIGVASPVATHVPATLTEHPYRRVQLVRGAVVGGSGAVNGGYFCRGLPGDFDGWRLPGWSWTDVLEAFRAIETDHDFRGPLHGDEGPIPVRRTREIVGSTAFFADAAERAGYRWVDDLNGGAVGSGIGRVPLNIADGRRVGPGAAFLGPATARPNLRVLAGVRALRVVIAGGRATGVEVDGETLSADRIVLCCGAIGSAHLLMLSGIGDAAMLRAAGVPVVVDLPVGSRSADHPEWVMPTDWANAAGRPVLEVVLDVDGDLEIRPYTGGFVAMTGDGAAGHPDWPHIGVALMRPLSRGRVTLASSDPRVAPAIEQRYDSRAEDTAALQRGAALAHDICGGTTTVGEPMWSTSQHLCGTAPMGDDEHAVVGPDCAVRGVDGLWVIDGSVLPVIPSRGPHATIVMIAYRAAEFVSRG